MADTSNEDISFVHDADESSGEFQLFVSGRRVGELTWKRLDPSTVDFNHTWVSKTVRGRGLAGRLVDTAALWARNHAQAVIPSCPYVLRVFDESSAYEDIDARNGATAE